MSESVVKKIYMEFAAGENKVAVSLPNPKEDLDSDTVMAAMSAVIEQGALTDAKGNPVDDYLTAALQTTTLTPLFT